MPNDPYLSTPTVPTMASLPNPSTTSAVGSHPRTGNDTEPLLGWAGFLITLGVLAFLVRWAGDKLADRARLRAMAGNVKRQSQPSWWDEGDDMPDPLP